MQATDVASFFTHYVTYIHTHTYAGRNHSIVLHRENVHAYMGTCVHAYMHTRVHAYMHTWVHAYMHTWVHAYMHTCIRAYMGTCIHGYMHTCIHLHTCVPSRSSFAWAFLLGHFDWGDPGTPVCIRIHFFMYVCMYVCVCMRLRSGSYDPIMPVCMYVHMYIHTAEAHLQNLPQIARLSAS
jgi:hypothetical protein